MSNENSQVRFMAARTAEEYLADAHREVTPIAGNPDTGIMWAQEQPLFISGDSGSGKTFSLLTLLRNRLEGGHWLERFPVISSRQKIAFLNLDRDGSKSRMKAMNLGKSRNLVVLDFLDLQGANFINQPELLVDIHRDTGATDIFIDGISQLVSDPTDTEQGSKFAVAVKTATQYGLNICGTLQNKKQRGDQQDPEGRGAWLGSAHILGACGIGITLKMDDGKQSSIRFRQVKGCDGREYVTGKLTASHEEHALAFSGGSVLSALQVLRVATRAELKEYAGISSDDTLKKRLKGCQDSWIELKPEQAKNPITGGTNPTRYKYVGPNSDLHQDLEGTTLNPLTIPNSVGSEAMLVKEGT